MANPPEVSAEDPYRDRPPTSHERQFGRTWDESYHEGPAPWDIEGPQPAIARLAAAGGFGGTILDAGCGSGDNALYLASLGLHVVGVDVAETALGRARAKAAELGADVEFGTADALHLEDLGRTFDVVLDCGLFHTFDGDERARYVTGLGSVLATGGTLYVLCFSDEGPDAGPHPVRREELTGAFGPGWAVRAVESTRVHTRFHGEHGAPAWLATVERT